MRLSEKLDFSGLAVHSGEKEALAFVFCHQSEDYYFCTGDAAALQALAVVGMKDKGISLEKLLNDIGLPKTLKHQFTENYFKTWIKKGSVRFVQEQKLTKK
jgi:hypothetical protein